MNHEIGKWVLPKYELEPKPGGADIFEITDGMRKRIMEAHWDRVESLVLRNMPDDVLTKLAEVIQTEIERRKE